MQITSSNGEEKPGVYICKFTPHHTDLDHTIIDAQKEFWALFQVRLDGYGGFPEEAIIEVYASCILCYRIFLDARAC